MKKFVYLINDYMTNEKIIKQNEVGIVLSESNDKSRVQFVEENTPIEIQNTLIHVFEPSKTGDQFKNKVCNRCNRLLPVEQFQKNQNGKNNRTVRRPSCNDCRDKIDGKDIPPKIKNKWEKDKPHMVIWECPICKKRTIPGLTSKVVLDHNHTTGTPNTWICDSCNTGLGRFNDDIEVMNQAIKYLEEHK